MAYNKKYAELGESVIDYVNDREDAIEDEISRIDGDLEDFENSVDNTINDFRNETIENIDGLSYDLENVKKPFNMRLALRFEQEHNNIHDTGGVKYGSVQGSCIVGNKLLVASINGTDSGLSVDNKAIIREYNVETGELLRISSTLMLYHANALTYDSQLNEIYVAHSNTQQSGGSVYNNDITVVDYNNLTVKRVITPNIPQDRRVKSVSYDFETNKLYCGDDKGVFEIDSNGVVLKTIDFDEKFFVNGVNVLGQHSAVYKNVIYYLDTEHNLGVFDIDGNLITIYNIPRNSLEGHYVGSEVQSISFNNDGDMFLLSRWDWKYNLENTLISYLFKTNLEKGVGYSYNYTRRPDTSKSVYVDPSTNNPRPDGTSSSPFNSLFEAIYYVLLNPIKHHINIYLKPGTYPFFTIYGYGNRFSLRGESGVVLQTPRFYYVDVDFHNIKFVKTPFNYNYCVLLSNGKFNFQTCEIDGENNNVDGIYMSVSIMNIRNNSTIRNCNNGVYSQADNFFIENAVHENNTNNVHTTASSMSNR